MELKLLSNLVKVRKCKIDDIMREDGEVLLHLPDAHKEWTNWVEILDVGPACKTILPEHIGRMAHCAENAHNDIHKLPSDWGEEIFVVREHLINEYLFAES